MNNSEVARYLATFLIEHRSEFFYEDSWKEGKLQEYLEKAIQEFYDTLP